MNIRSLALTTELALAATRGTITDRGDYLVVQTPDDPGYYHGNVLVLPAPPQVGEVAYWTRRFASELGDLPAVTLWWDGVTGDPGAADELRAAGFTIQTNLVMVAEAVEAPEPAGFELRPLSADEVLATADLAWAIGDRHDESYRQFLHRRAVWHQGLVARGTARFWGAFAPPASAGSPAELVASLGLVRLGALARYQDVQTAIGARGQGLAGALLAAAAREAFAAEAEAGIEGGNEGGIEGGISRVVIVAEPDSAAARLYTRIGFHVVERTCSACRYPTGG